MDLTENLELINIYEYSAGSKSYLRLDFLFFDERGYAYINIKKLNDEYPDFSITGIADELSDSFNEALEDNWDDIISAIKEHLRK